MDKQTSPGNAQGLLSAIGESVDRRARAGAGAGELDLPAPARRIREVADRIGAGA